MWQDISHICKWSETAQKQTLITLLWSDNLFEEHILKVEPAKTQVHFQTLAGGKNK